MVIKYQVSEMFSLQPPFSCGRGDKSEYPFKFHKWDILNQKGAKNIDNLQFSALRI